MAATRGNCVQPAAILNCQADGSASGTQIHAQPALVSFTQQARATRANALGQLAQCRSFTQQALMGDAGEADSYLKGPV